MYKPFFLNFREATTLVRSLEVAPGSYQLYLLCVHVHNEERGPWVCPLPLNVGEEEPRVPKEPLHIQSYLSWNSLVTSNWILMWLAAFHSLGVIVFKYFKDSLSSKSHLQHQFSPEQHQVEKYEREWMK